jgi:hypothetical protein
MRSAFQNQLRHDGRQTMQRSSCVRFTRHAAIVEKISAAKTPGATLKI